jgi:hypothetical protein
MLKNMGSICIHPRSLDVRGYSAIFPLPIEKTVIFLSGIGPNADKSNKGIMAVYNINFDDI